MLRAAIADRSPIFWQVVWERCLRSVVLQIGDRPMALTCECPHEDCGAIFEHSGAAKETTCCPACGRQQTPHPVKPDNLVDGLLDAVARMSKADREGFFGCIRERFCVFCGAETPTHKCWDCARGEDV